MKKSEVNNVERVDELCHVCEKGVSLRLDDSPIIFQAVCTSLL